MNSQTILITGSTDGIGKLAAMRLAEQQAHVLLHGRDKHKVALAVAEIQCASANKNIEGFTADFSSLDEVRQLSMEILGKHRTLDVLINNAGVGTSDKRYNKDGMELRFTVNYLAPFLLTQLLLTALQAAAPSRIVNVSSAGQQAVDFDDIMLENNFDGVRAYCQSKLALIMFTIDLAARMKDGNITVNSLHPGTYLDTNMVRNSGIAPLGKPATGADAEVFLATSPQVDKVTGKYFNVKSEAKAHPQAYDAVARKKLWELSMQLTGLHEKATK